METHIVPANARPLGSRPNHRTQYRALCGKPVDDLQHVSHDPTCKDCARIDEEETQPLMRMTP